MVIIRMIDDTGAIVIHPPINRHAAKIVLAGIARCGCWMGHRIMSAKFIEWVD